MKTIGELDTYDPKCRNCDGTGWVCENHPDKPWADGYRYPGETRMTGCDCGAGCPCKECNDLAGYGAPSAPDEVG